MLIAMTYDLKADYLAMGLSEEAAAEFDSPATVEAIEAALSALGHRVERVGALPALMRRLLDGARWDLVFNICEGLNGYGREAQVPAVLDWFGVPYVFSDPLTLAMTLHKGVAKHVVRGHGLPTPDFAVVERPEDARAVNLPFPLFVKPVAEGTGMGIGAASRAVDRQGLEGVCAELIARFRQPALVEAYLPGRELTVGIVGTETEARSLGVMEVVMTGRAESDAYGYVNKAEYLSRVEYRLVEMPRAEEVALACWRALGCRDGGRVDLRCDASGLPCFLEVNPLAGLHPINSDLPILCRLAGVPYHSLIAAMVESAARRLGATVHAPRTAASPAA